MTEVPDLRIVDEELWQAVKARQETIAIQYANVIEATRSAHTALNRTHRPKSLLSGLVYCGCCGGPYSLRGQGRFACSNHVDTKSCSNGHSITRDKLEARVLDGLRDRMMTPEVAAEAIRTYVEESNRINHQRRASENADRTDLQKVLKAIKGLVTLAKEGKGTRALVDEILELEAQEDAIRARLAAAPADVPDIHPNISEIYRRKVERLTHALSQPEERQEAADALRALIERIDLTPGAKRGEVNAMLYGEFGRILEWIEQRRLAENAQSPGACAPGLCGMSVSVVAGGRSNRDRQSKEKSGLSVSVVAGEGLNRDRYSSSSPMSAAVFAGNYNCRRRHSLEVAI